MKLRSLFGRAWRWGAAAAVVLALASPAAHAATSTDPIFPPVLVQLGFEPAPTVCSGDSVWLRVHLVDSCMVVQGFAVIDSLPTVTVRRTRPFGQDCPRNTLPLPLDRRYPLGRFTAGEYLMRFRVVVIVPTDSASSNVTQDVRTLALHVRGDCTPPPPPPPVRPHGLRLFIGAGDSAQACPGEPVPVKLLATEENTCVNYLGWQLVPAMSSPLGDVLLVRFRLGCADSLACLQVAHPVRDSFFLPASYPGRRVLDVLVSDSTCADSARILDAGTYAYTVLDSCAPPPPPPPTACVMPFLRPAPRIEANVDVCDLRIAPGATGRLVLAASAEGVRLAGLQGAIGVGGAPLRIERLEPTGDAAGMRLETRRRDDGGMEYVLWADHGAPIPANQYAPVLAVVLRADSGAVRCTSSVGRCEVRGHVGASVTAASDSLGGAVAICPVATFAPVVATVCVGQAPAPASCDANRDGIVNVADLVRMVRCWFRPAECPDSVAAHPDCNGDGVHSPSDLLCCARGMLGGPRDSTAQRPNSLAFAFGEPRLVNGRVELPLVVRGGGELGGALLRLTCPADRYQWDDGITIDGPASMTDTGTDQNWLVTQDADGDDRLLGLLRLGESASDEITTTLYLRLRDGQQPGGAVSITASELSGADGAPLDLDLATVQGTLPSASVATASRLELSAARPNPTGGATTFALALPSAGDVDLGIFDLAGRRVATLFSGRLAAGTREFTWSGAAHSGVYFARLVVDGEVRTSRVVVRRLR